jgi:hypothetical protein
MYARMTVAQAKPDSFDEAVTSVRETFLPSAREEPEYHGFLLLSDRATQQLVGISIWKTEAGMRTGGEAGGYFNEAMDRFLDLVASPPVTTTHEVVVIGP